MNSSTANILTSTEMPGLFAALRNHHLKSRDFVLAPDMPLETEPFLTVVVLNFNGEKVLSSCLNALLAQEYSNFKIVIVDNASTDSSKELIQDYTRKHSMLITSVMLPRNMGVAGGRNAAIEHCQGDFVAFIDNDGFADPNWLKASVAHLLSSPSLGAISSLVFFSKRETLLNGAGGFRDERGYGSDYNFSQPIEIATIEQEALFPMGCGMVLSKEAVDKCFPLDAILPKWYDDVEIGERIWRSGLRVEVCKQAHVLHGFHGADDSISPPGWKRALLFEKARIRHALKYPPKGGILHWMKIEALALTTLTFAKPKQVIVTLIAGLWNAIHLLSLPTATSSQKGEERAVAFYNTDLDSPARKTFPENHLLPYQSSSLSSCLSPADSNDASQLHYGWFIEAQELEPGFVALAQHSSAFFKLEDGTNLLEIDLLSAPAEAAIKIEIRSLDNFKSLYQEELTIPSNKRESLCLDIPACSGLVELLITHSQVANSKLAISSIKFSSTNG